MDEKKLKAFESLRGNFFTIATHRQNDCEKESIKRKDSLGDELSITLANLDACLQNVDSIASCFWGCAGGNHAIEYLLGRIKSFSIAAIRLANMGHYDEALSLIRTNGEISNLLALFLLDIEEANQWCTLDDKTRQNKFSPLSVRKKLESHGMSPPMDKDTYKELSSFGIHANPQTPPQIHNLSKVPITGGTYQVLGYVKCIEHLAITVGFSCGFAVRILKAQSRLDEKIAESSLMLAVKLVKEMGTLSLTGDISKINEEIRVNSRKIFTDAIEYQNTIKNSLNLKD